MRNVPATVLQQWPAPNYVNPQNQDRGVLVCGAICIAIIVPVVFARIGIRTFIIKSFGVDDWLIIPAALAGLGYCIGALLGTRYGWYRHIWDVPISRLDSVRKLVVSQSLLGLLNVAFTKLSVLCLYRRLVPPSWLRTIVNVMLCITTAWLVSMFITNFLLCIPIPAYWDIFYKGNQICLQEVAYYVSFSAIDLVLDTIVCILPLFIIIPLQAPRRQKWILGATFAIGLLTIISAGLRLPSLLRASKSYDLTWELYHAAIWTQVEAAVGITCASVPALKPLVARYAPMILDSLPTRSKSVSANPDIEHGLQNDRSPGTIQKTTNLELFYSSKSAGSRSQIGDG